ncbi:MAG: hypothetical protein FJX89_03735 [Bacteroidetes bacterium]|nr:hypothetical protein [Bacteroidota bacterium]
MNRRSGLRAVWAALFLGSLTASAQENSPYSRFGLGDMLNGQNIVSRSMGGLSIGFADYQAVNFVNPASYANLKVTTLDVGVEVSSRTLRASSPVRRFNSKYMIPTYLQIGMPLSKKKNWGLNMGMAPLTRIDYNLNTRTRVAGIDSVLYNYMGKGGTYQAFMGTGFGGKHLSAGINAGYRFGNKLYNTRVILINDTVPYRKSNSADTTRFGGLYAEGGLLYTANLSKSTKIRIGLTGSLQQKMQSTRDISRETFEYSPSNGIDIIDSVYRVLDQEGKIVYPSSYGFGFTVERESKWLFGAEFQHIMWGQYRYYGAADPLRDSWTARVGGQYLPDGNGKGYWSRVIYRAGLSYGTDPIVIGNTMNKFLLTAGVALPVRRSFYTNQFTTVNLALEAGTRGNKSNAVRENLFRIALGFNLSDIWFNPRKYD